MPFEDPGRAPTSTRKDIKSFLLKYLGDPRFDNSKRWSAVRPDCRRRFTSWLVEDVFEQFLAVMRETVREGSAGKQLKGRIPFWTSLYKKGKITDAYAAFGPDAARHARKAFPDLPFGRLSGNNSNNNSVLLFEYYGRICVEFSNDGAFRAWERNKGPILHQESYRTPDSWRGYWQRQTHQGRVETWQGKIQTILRRIEREESRWGA